MAARKSAPNYLLARLMSDAGFTSHKAFARAVRRISEEAQGCRPIGCDHTSVSRWLSGMMPRAETALCIAAVLSRALGRQVSPDEAGLTASMPVPLDLGLQYPESLREAIVTAARLWRVDLDEAAAVTSRSANAAVWQQVPLSWLVAPPAAEPLPARGEARVGSADVGRVRATIELFGQLDNQYGGGHARRALVQYLADDVARLLRGRYGNSVGAELLTATAEATLLAAWMSYDSGLHSLAQRYFVQALGFAEASGNRLLAGSILDAMSHQATFLGRFRDAANLARAARAGTGHLATPSLTAHFYAMEARALARLADTRGCELALSEAVRMFERRNPENEPEWFQYFDDAELAAEFGHCYRDIGRHERAALYATQSIGATCGARSDFFVTIVLAAAHLQAGEAEQACRTALDALRLGEQLSSARCVSYLCEFQAQLTAVGNAAAIQEFHEQAAVSPLWRQAAPAGIR